MRHGSRDPNLSDPPAAPPLTWLPPEDKSRSPITGWTRAHWEATADRILTAGRAHSTPGGSFVKSSPEQGPVVGLEGFARTSLLAAYRIATADAQIRDPLVSWLGRGIETGTRQGTPDSWPVPGDRDQSIVESAWIAIALAETRAHLWDQLDDNARSQILRWLSTVRGRAVHPNNWLLYPVIVDAFVQQVTAGPITRETEYALRQVNALYARDGWYSDGPGTCFGHYSGWGIQLLLAHWLRMTGGEAFPGGPAAIRERLHSFLTDYVALIGADGGPVLHGRSLVYRFAAAAPFWLGTMLDATPFRDGTTRRMASAITRYFVDHGALDGGMPSLGWHGPFPALADSYSTPVSPLLANEAFVGLLLPPEHGAWADIEEPAPVDAPSVCVLRTPGFVCMGTGGHEGVTRLASHGAWCPSFEDHPGYRKLGYSNRTAPAVGRLGELDLDGQITVITPNGVALRRRRFALVAAGDRYAASVWEPEASISSRRHRTVARIARYLPRRLAGAAITAPSVATARVETASVARVDMELRVTHLWALDGGVIRDGGLAVSHDIPPSITYGDGWCAVTTADGLTAAVVGLYGYGASACEVGTGASPFGRHSVVPFVDGDGEGPESVLVVAHVLTHAAFDPEAIRASMTIERLNRRAIVIHTADGDHQLVQLFRPVKLQAALGPRILEGTYRYARSSADGTYFELPAS